MTGQELQLAIGIRDKFSWGEVGSVAIAATLESGMQGIEQVAGYGTGINAGVHLSEQMQLVERIIRSGALSSAQQLTEMAAGLRHKFDVRLVGSAILNTLSTDKITHLNLGRASVLSMPLSTMTTSLITPVVTGQRFNAGVIAAQVMGQIAGNELGGALGSGARDYLRSQQQSINQRQSAAYPNPSRAQSKTLPEPSMANRDKVRRWQEEQSVTRRKNWGQADTSGLDSLVQETFEDMMRDSLNPQRRFTHGKSVEDWERPTAVQAREGSREMLETSLASNPHLKRVVGPNGHTSYVDKDFNVYYATDQGIRRIYDPPTESLHFIEDFALGGVEVGLAKLGIGLLKGMVKAGPGIAKVGAETVGGMKGLAGDAFSKLVDGFGVLGTKVRSLASSENDVIVLFRSVNHEELNQIINTKQFAKGPNSLEGKFFAENYNDAQKWGDIMNGVDKHTVIEVHVPTTLDKEMMRWPKLDDIGPARYGTLDQLENVKIYIPELSDEIIFSP